MSINWYVNSGTRVNNSKSITKDSKGLVKTAQSLFNQESDCSARNQTGEWEALFDVQRYVMDAYMIRIAISKTYKKYTVTLMTNHAFLGTIGWEQYWAFSLDQKDKAVSTYKQVKQSVEDLLTEFVENELPTSIFWPKLKAATNEICPDDVVSSNIPHINYAHRYRSEIAPDWRKNIYGTRYPGYGSTTPGYEEISFEQRKNNANK